MAIVVENGITVGPGISIGAGGAAPGPSGVDNVLGYAEMNPPIVPGNQLEDPTATINGSVGFTINDDTKTGVAVTALTVSNDNWISTNYITVPGTYTCSYGPGSTVASSSIIVTQASTSLVFFIQGQSGPATYNYPFTLGL